MRFIKINMKLLPVAAITGLLVTNSSLIFGQVKVDIPGVSINAGNGNATVNVGRGNTVKNTSGSIQGDVEMEGVAIINDDVFIDGEKIPRGKTRYTSKKSGKSYRIQWGKNGNVTVDQN
jgi:hypothetical protein